MGAVAVLALLIWAFADADEPTPDNGNGDGDGDGDANGMTNEEWLARVQTLIHFDDDPQQAAFYQITGGGPGADSIAGMMLARSGNDTGANRIRLVKCIEQSQWNELYMSARPASSWGTAYNIMGRNLATAWLPRHESAIQAIANRRMPVRGINEQGGQVNGGAHFGLIWIPRFNAGDGFVACTDVDREPPGWFMGEIMQPLGIGRAA